MSKSASPTVFSASLAKRRRRKRRSARTIRYDAFQRPIQLPAGIDPDGVKAQFKGGVLTVTLAKDEKAPERTRKIAIEQA
jgi:HSP20 family molecular chaperone IbpA